MCREAAGREEKEAIAHHNDPAFQALHGVSMGVPCETELTEITYFFRDEEIEVSDGFIKELVREVRSRIWT